MPIGASFFNTAVNGIGNFLVFLGAIWGWKFPVKKAREANLIETPALLVLVSVIGCILIIGEYSYLAGARDRLWPIDVPASVIPEFPYEQTKLAISELEKQPDYYRNQMPEADVLQGRVRAFKVSCIAIFISFILMTIRFFRDRRSVRLPGTKNPYLVIMGRTFFFVALNSIIFRHFFRFF